MSPTTILYISQGIHGLAYGMLLFLLASGLTMIFGMMGILNIAHIPGIHTVLDSGLGEPFSHFGFDKLFELLP